MAEQIPLPGTSPAYDKAEGIVRTVIFDVALEKLFDKILNAVPWLGYPVIKQVFMFCVTKILSVFYAMFEEMVALAMIDMRVTEQRKAYTDAMQKLREEVHKPEGEKNAEEIAKAKQLAKDKLRALISFRP